MHQGQHLRAYSEPVADIWSRAPEGDVLLLEVTDPAWIGWMSEPLAPPHEHRTSKATAAPTSRAATAAKNLAQVAVVATAMALVFADRLGLQLPVLAGAAVASLTLLAATVCWDRWRFERARHAPWTAELVMPAADAGNLTSIPLVAAHGRPTMQFVDGARPALVGSN